MSSEASETECKQRVSNRGKNFSVAEDKQICLSWMYASKICNQSVSNNIYIWGILYDHAVTKEQDLEARTASSLRHRFLSIQREVRKFSDIHNLINPDETESVLENALQTYKSCYKTHFKFLQCWEILREYPKFLQMAETHSNVVKISIEKKEAENPEIMKAASPFAESVRKSSRGLNVLPDEIQALLKACRDVGVEEARSKGERIEPLLYDVQQQMANYGRFSERKLYVVKKQYLRTEKNYRNGDLVPYPPEARILWGKNDTSKDDESNDASWNNQIQYNLDHWKGLSFLSDLEIQELLKEAVKKNVESISQAKRKIIFYDILSTMHAKKLCRRKNAEQLLQDYLRLKKQFSTGICKYLPVEATLLWTSDGTEEEPVEEVQEEPILQPVDEEPMLQISFADCTLKSEVADVCRICQAELFDQTYDLFLDVYKSQTYAAIIKEALNVEMANDGRSTVICDHCTTFIENLVNFVQQCRESCVTNDSYREDFTFEKHETLEFEASLESDGNLKDEHKNLISADYIIDDAEYLMNDDDILNEVNEATNDDTSPPEAIPVEDIAEETLDEDTRKKRNYRKYLESRTPNRGQKRQCHLCGKKVVGLVDHLESHSGKEFKCNFCDWVCPNRRQLRIHMNRHTKKHVFPCRYCDKLFYVWSSRKNHEDTHTKSAYKCDICGMEYKHKSYFLAHKKAIHLGIRNLKCTQCKFSTFIKARLLNHVRSIHTSERPYKCSVCEHTSNSSTGYYIHFQRHKKSGEVVDYSIKCAYCKELFAKDAALEAHIVKDHPDRAVKI
ncbi:uncharacterized protein LOC135700584 [Ochlerotatus camptorhynchus]|uniref:uncharacterized protein LOC135700584 n=1 Tax=Ochlerotatus camptorhynchus TaxID=644619 RepID=UPI0031E16162